MEHCPDHFRSQDKSGHKIAAGSVPVKLQIQDDLPLLEIETFENDLNESCMLPDSDKSDIMSVESLLDSLLLLQTVSGHAYTTRNVDYDPLRALRTIPASPPTQFRLVKHQNSRKISSTDHKDHNPHHRFCNETSESCSIKRKASAVAFTHIRNHSWSLLPSSPSPSLSL